MQTLPRGNGAPSQVAPAPDGLAPDSEIRHVVVAREDVLRHPAAPPRSPSGSLPAAESAAPIADKVDEELVTDPRAGVSPAAMVELKLRSLLRGSAVSNERSGVTPPGRGPLHRG